MRVIRAIRKRGKEKMAMKKKLLEQEALVEKNGWEKGEANRELRRNIVIGAVLRSLHRKQGTMPYLIQAVEPYLKKSDRQLFGLF